MLEGEGVVEDIGVGDGSALSKSGGGSDGERSKCRSGGSSGELHVVDVVEVKIVVKTLK